MPEPTFTIDQINALTEKCRGLRAFITSASMGDGEMHLHLLFMAPKGTGWMQMGEELWRWDGERWQTR